MRNYIQVIVVVIFCISPICTQSGGQETSDTNYDDLINELTRSVGEDDTKIEENEGRINEEENKFGFNELENEWNNVTESLTNEFAQCQNETKAQKVEMEDLQNKTLQYKAELNEKNSEIAKLNADLKSFQENNLKYAQQLQSTLAALETNNKKIAELEAKNKENEKELSVRDDQITQLNTKLTKSETELKARSQSLEECRSQALGLQSNLKLHDISNRKRDDELNLKDAKIAQLNTNLTKCENEFNTFTQNLKECQSQAQELQSNIASYKNSIKEKDEEISDLKTSNEQINSTHEIAQMKLKTCQTSLEKTQKEITENQTKNDEHNKKKNQVKKQIEDLKKELKTVNDQLMKCQANLTTKIDELKQNAENSKITEKQLENCQANVTTCKKDIEELKQNAGKVKSTEEKLAKCESLKKTIDSIYEDLKKETEKNEAQQKNCREQSNALSQCQSNLTSCQTKTSSLEGEVKRKEAENKDLKTSNETYNSILEICESSRRTVEKNYEDLKKETKKKDAQLQGFGDQSIALSQCQKNSSSCQTKSKIIEAQNEDLHRRNVECRDFLGEYERNMTSCTTRIEKLREACLLDINSCKRGNGQMDQKNKDLNIGLGKCQLENNEIQGKLMVCNEQKGSQTNKLAQCESEKRITQTSIQQIELKLKDCENKQQRSLQPKYFYVDQTETFNKQRPPALPRNPSATALPSSCSNSAGIASIRLSSGNQIRVRCNNNIAGPGWITILHRSSGLLSFEKNWKDYRNGFGDVNGESFLGLEKIYLLTNSKQHELLIQLTDQKNSVNTVRYDNFKIGNEQSQYRLQSLGSFSGDVTDDLSWHINRPFTTPDRDNIHGSRQCASERRAGWWYRPRVCASTNLHGPYGSHFIWYDRARHYIRLKEVRMIIRPTSSNSQLY